MSVVVKVHRRARDDIARWVRSLPGPEADRRALAAITFEAVRAFLREMEGRVPGADVVPRVRPPTYQFRIGGGWWVRYRVRTRRRFFFRREVTVLIVGLGPDRLA